MRLEDLVGIHYKKLNENDFSIWEFISAHKDECCNNTIEWLAKKCNVSRTTVMRFAQKLNLNGFSEMKIYLKWECNERQTLRQSVMQDICNDYRKLIDDMESKDLTDVCHMIAKARRIFVYGTGSVQGSVARELQRVFLSAHVCMTRIEGGWGETDLVAEIAQPDDLAIIISMSGESVNAVQFAKKLDTKRVPILSLTKNKNNQLARMSSYNLYVSTSLITTSYALNYETSTLFFMAAELLLVKYLFYIQNDESNA